MVEEAAAVAADLPAADWLGYVPEPPRTGSGNGSSLIASAIFPFLSLHFFTGELKCENVQVFGELVGSISM